MSNNNAVGIIAEYNPFHKGHAYHIQQSKLITGSRCAVVVMSGNFVQRGEPAMIDKYIRTDMALLNGADLVVELPALCSVGSSSYFSIGSIKLLDALHVDNLCFGSEDGNISSFNNTAQLILEHTGEIDTAIHEQVKTGVSYPLARSIALSKCIGNSLPSDFLSKPNNILGLEYLLEIKKQNSSIVPHTIKRIGNQYHDTTVSDDFSSAGSLRIGFLKNPELLYANIPENCVDMLKHYFSIYKPVFIDDFSDIVFYKLLEIKNQRESGRNITFDIADLPEYLLNKILNNLNNSGNITELIGNVKTKDLTYTRISRALMHLLLNISDKDYEALKTAPCPYIRVLGFNETGQKYLSSIKKELTCPVIVKPADYKEQIRHDIYASDIYNLVLGHKSGSPVTNDYKRQIR